MSRRSRVSSADLEEAAARSARAVPSRRKRCSGRSRRSEQLERLHARVGLDVDEVALPSRCVDAIHAARQRTPLPDISERLPSALKSCMDAPPLASLEDDQAVGADAAMAIADVARERQRVGDAGKSRASIRRKSLPKACDLMRFIAAISFRLPASSFQVLGIDPSVFTSAFSTQHSAFRRRTTIE